MARGGFYSVDSLRGTYVLLVEPDQENRAMLCSILRYCGALVREAASADEGLAALRETIPEIVVVGIRPPTDAAWALIGILRTMRAEDGSKIPAVGVGSSTEAGSARTNGFNDYLEEPIDPWQLCRMVSELTG